MVIKKVILITLILPFLLIWGTMLLMVEIFSALEDWAGVILDKWGKAVARVIGLKNK